MFLAECLDFDVHTGRQLELHERVHRLLRRLENIEQALVGADLKLLSRLSCPRAGERNTQYLFFTVGSGIGPAIWAPVRRAPCPQFHSWTGRERDNRKLSGG